LRYAPLQTAELVAAITWVCFPEAATAVDLTPGHGNFWSERVPVRVSVEASRNDFTALPYADLSYDVVYFDPPHNADAGARSIMGQRFGTYPHGELEDVVRRGTREAWRVARLGVVVKVTDSIHAQKFIRMSGWIYEELGEPFDVVHQLRRRAMIDKRWKLPQLSARNNGSSYLVFRRDGLAHVRRQF